MIKFDNFYCLIEGGNLSIDNKYFADEIKLQYLDQKSAAKFVNDFENLLRDINKIYKSVYNEPLWSQLETLLKTNKIYAGSAKIFFEYVKQGKFDLFREYKKTVGDIDVQFGEDCASKLRDLFYGDKETNLSNETAPKKIGEFTFVGEGGTGAIQMNTLFAYNFGIDMRTGVKKENADTYIQIDFEPVTFEKGLPTRFSQFAHSADFNDIQNSIKGVFHKFLLQSLLDVSNEIIADIKLYTTKGKATTRKGTKLTVYSFSVDKGFRERYVPALTRPDGNVILDNNQGKQVYFDVKSEERNALKSTGFVTIDQKSELFKDLIGVSSLENHIQIPINVESLNYNQDLDILFRLIFGIEPDESSKEGFNSYTGLLNLMSKNKKELDNKNKDFPMRVYKNFVEKIYGSGAQLLYKRDIKNPKPQIMIKDFETKQAPVNLYQQYFPEVTNAFSKEQFDNLINTYYTSH
jgi:hypothetical protein